MFVIKFKCKEAKGTGDYTLIREGSSAWVVNESEGWVEATARNAEHSDELHTDLKVFNTQEEAKNFMERWEGHPWYYAPNGSYEIIEVKERFEKVLTGYTRVAQETQD